ATSQEWLLGARVLQGIGGALAAPTALSLIAVTFPEGPPRNRAMGVYAAMSVAGGAVGLIAGGLGLAALVYGLSSAATSPNGVSHWGDTKVIVSLVAAVVLLVTFGFIE